MQQQSLPGKLQPGEFGAADPRADLGLVAALRPTISADAQPELDYWRSLVGDDEFPLGTWLRRRS